ncbi:unnamed protein product [Symbiodinium necroappetens]|uniref:Uncharacterized protein n=1 Tax=Symbiodinium necroappetens TaxID=1628268 RepID=A0A813C589_9DINO|nr:unnamed protein product [Symbiodinium necroappetens]
MVEKAAAVVKGIATGSLSGDATDSIAGIAWNFDSSSGGASQTDLDLGNGFTCHNCFFDLGASVHLELNIQDYKVEHLVMYLEGDAKMQYDVSLQPQYFHASNDTVISTLKLDEVHFSIAGIPFVLDTTVPISLGYDAVLEIGQDASVRAMASIDGSWKGGVAYSSKDSTLHHIDERKFEPSGKLSASATAGFQVHLFPQVVFLCDHLGGPTLGLKPSVDVVVGAAVGSETCPTDRALQAGLFAQIHFGLQVALGAKIDIELAGVPVWKRSWPALLSHTFKWPLLSSCVSSDGRGGLAATPSLLPAGAQPLATGVAFTGTLMPDTSRGVCARYPAVPLTVQLTSEQDAHLLSKQPKHGFGFPPQDVVFTTAQNGKWAFPLPGERNDVNYNAFGSLQLDYQWSGDQLGSVVDRASCQAGSAQKACYTFVYDSSPDLPQVGLPAFIWFADLSPDMSEITLQKPDAGSCYHYPVSLKRTHGQRRFSSHTDSEAVYV